MKKPLNAKRELYCREYLKDLNQTKAAERAGYAPKQAVSQASRLMRDPKIQARIAELMSARAKRVEIDADQVLEELSRIGFSDVRALFDDRGAIKDTKDWPRSLARAIASIEVNELFDYDGGQRKLIGQVKKIRFWPKVQALELMGRHVGMFAQKHVLEAGGSLEALVAASRKKKDVGVS